MKIKFLSLILVLSIVFVSFSFFLPSVKSSGNELYVNADYKGYSDGSAEKPYDTIQEALNEAEEGDTIYIFGGLYQEDFVINKKIKLWGGIDGVETVIDTRFERRYLVEITADEVTLEDITFSDDNNKMESPIGALIAIKSDNNQIVGNILKNNSLGYGLYIDPSSSDNLVSNNVINHTRRGIYIDSSSTNDLANNEIHNCTEYGIYMDSSGGNNRLYSNEIYYCQHGIFVENSNNLNLTSNTVVNSEYYAIYVSQCQEGVIVSNNIKDGQGDGIYIKSESFYIKNNTVSNSVRGITLSGSYNTVVNNTFENLSASGVYVGSGYDNNILYLNKFKANGVSAKDLGDNKWYYQSEGNYWSDYNNIDKDEDGIGDVSYLKNGVIDKYPLGYFLKPPDKAVDPSPEDTETGVSLSITLDVKVTDPDSEYLDVYFYNGDDDTLIYSQTQNPKTHVQNNTRVQCSFTLGFDRTFAWYVVTDDGLLQNTSDVFFFSTMSTPPGNLPPEIDIGGPYSGEAYDTILFNGSGCYDIDGEIDFYRWNFGDASSEILQKNPTHVFESEGTYEVTLTVIDNNGSSTTEITNVVIQPSTNSPPIVSFSVPAKSYSNKKVSFISTSTDPDNDDLTYKWQIGDKNFSGEEISFKFETPGEYVYTLTVSDGIEETSETSSIIIEEKKSDDSPGFEIILVFLALLLIGILKRRKK